MTTDDLQALNDLSVYDWLKIMDALEPGAANRVLSLFGRKAFAKAVDKYDAGLRAHGPPRDGYLDESPISEAVRAANDAATWDIYKYPGDSWLFQFDTDVAQFAARWFT